MNKGLIQDLNAVYNGLNEDLDESKILLGNIIDKLEKAINYTQCCETLKDRYPNDFVGWLRQFEYTESLQCFEFGNEWLNKDAMWIEYEKMMAS